MQLTETVQFGMCVVAGVPIEYDYDNLTWVMTMRTARKCAVIEPEPGRFIVCVARDAAAEEKERRERYLFGG
jgi:hypothetical protein